VRPLRLLQVSAFFAKHGGGIEVVAEKLALELAASGVEVHWMAGGAPGEKPEFPSPGLLTVEQANSRDRLEPRLGIPAPLWSWGSLRKLHAAIRACDLVQVHDFLYQPTLLAIGFARRLGKPVVLTQHIGPIPYRSRVAKGALSLIHKTVGRFALSSARQVIFIARPVEEYFSRFARYRAPPLLIPNGVDHAIYQPAGARTQATRLRCLFVGRFVEKKGLALLEQCMSIDNLKWQFIGGGPLSPRAWARSERLEIHEGLHGAEVVPFFQAADLLVLPSVGEGFPLVVQEALSCGTPVLISQEVAAAIPGLDPRCVFTVDLARPAPVAALREKLLELERDRALLEAARPAALEFSQRWSWKSCVERYRAVYTAVLPSAILEPD
jgi:glycosyltransferase involved in cell wall biosynthesis